MWKVSKFSELPYEIQGELYDKYKDDYKSFVDFCLDIENRFNNFIREGSFDIIRTVDYCYIIKEYFIITKSYRLSVIGNSYLKDQCVCDEDLSEDVVVHTIDEYRGSLETITILKSEYNKLIKIKNLYDSENSK